jgi:DNA-binding transcriptional regulator YdaS (Cro superfamily)
MLQRLVENVNATLTMPKTTKKPTRYEDLGYFERRNLIAAEQARLHRKLSLDVPPRKVRGWLRVDQLNPRPRTLKAWLHANRQLTQRAFAKRLGCSQAMVSMLAQGERAARPKLAVRIEQLTGLPHDLFLDLGVNKPRKKRSPPGKGGRTRTPVKRGTDDDDVSDDSNDGPPDDLAD